MKTTNKILLTLFILILIGITAALIYIRVQISQLREQPESSITISEQHINHYSREVQGF